MTAIRSEDERFADFLRSAVPRLDASPAPVPREEMWTRIMAQRHGHALLLNLAGDTAGATGPSAQATAASSERTLLRTIAAHGRQVSLTWAMPLVTAGVVLGIVLGLQLGERRGRVEGVALSTTATTSRSSTKFPAQLVAERHFREVKQLLTTFATLKETGNATRQVNAEMVARARDLLSTTQLLLDSPLGMDPQRRHLLTDVELVLMQITQLAPSAPAEDRDLVEQSIEHSQVVPQLQHMAPTATVQSGT